MRKARLRLIASMLIFGTIGLVRRYLPLPSGLIACVRGAGGAELRPARGSVFCAVRSPREMLAAANH